MIPFTPFTFLPSNGSSSSLLELQNEMRPRMVASLKGRGAGDSVAEDVAEDILSECMRPGVNSLLNRFHGKCPLDSWLLRVAINRLITRQRRERMLQPLCIKTIEEARPNESTVSEWEVSLRELVARALRSAISSLPVQSRVLLWLHYGFAIPQKRLCRSWNCNASKLSRILAEARCHIRTETLAIVSREEPGLILRWEDVSGVCADSDLYCQ